MQVIEPLLREDFDAPSFAAGFYSISQLDSFLSEAETAIDSALRSLGPAEERRMLDSLPADRMPDFASLLPADLPQKVSDTLSQNLALQGRTADAVRKIEEFMTIQRVGSLLRGSLVSLASYLKNLPSVESVQAKITAGEIHEAEKMLKAVGRARWLFEQNPDLLLLSCTQNHFRRVQELYEQLKATIEPVPAPFATLLARALG